LPKKIKRLKRERIDIAAKASLNETPAGEVNNYAWYRE